MNTIDTRQDGNGSTDDKVFFWLSHRRGQLSRERAARKKRIAIGSINAACDEFFRSRGMLRRAHKAGTTPSLAKQPARTQLKTTS
jgi:hypothetical protein